MASCEAVRSCRAELVTVENRSVWGSGGGLECLEGGSYPCDGWREDARADDDPAKRTGLGRTDDRLEFEPKIRKSGKENPLLDLVVAPSAG